MCDNKGGCKVHIEKFARINKEQFGAGRAFGQKEAVEALAQMLTPQELETIKQRLTDKGPKSISTQLYEQLSKI